MNNDFVNLQKFIDESNATNSTNDKIKVLSKYKDNEFIKKTLLYTYSSFKKYYVTSKNLIKNSKLCAVFPVYTDLFDLLDVLDSRTITGHDAIREVNSFIYNNKEHKELIYSILDRNLKNRMTTKLIDRVFPNYIPTFEVALANKYDKKLAQKIDFKNDKWFVSRKLDGIRCIIIIDNLGVPVAYSREGNEFETMNVLLEEIKKFNLKNIVFDGEVCLIDENGKENFQGIIKEYNRKNHTIKNPKLLIFDLIDLKEFIQKIGSTKLSERYDNLKKIMSLYNYNYDIIEILPQIEITDESILTDMIAQGKREGWEGVMLRKDVNYEGKRSNNLLKVKSFFDNEYIVKDIEIGPFRIISGGKEVSETVMSNVLIDHKGFLVSVGSGFSLEERRLYKEYPEKIIGKQITVSYFEETKNQKGEISLRFPTVKAIYEQKRNI